MRKIAVFTGTRAEYGILSCLLQQLKDSQECQLQLLVGGMHMSPEFGMTVQQIETDGYEISEKMEFLLSGDSPVAISKSMALALISSADAFERLQPDLIVLLGDRFEALAVAAAAMNARIPIAHIHGGETTEGQVDEAIRHSITKMSHLHFTSTEAYKNRVIQLGEDPSRVFNVGAPGIDNIVNLVPMSRKELSSSLNFDCENPYFLVTYHPVTLSVTGGVEAMKEMMDSLVKFLGHNLIISFPNADSCGRKLIHLLNEYQEKYKDRILVKESFGQTRYLSLMKHAAAVVGNSSSGLIEAPSFNVPTVNIGNRQKGRISGETVVNCNGYSKAITNSLDLVISSAFKEKIEFVKSPYGEGNASTKIKEIIVSVSLDNIIYKPFHNL